VWDGRSGFAIEEFARRHGDFAIAGAAVALELDDSDRVRRCGIGLLGLGSTPLRGSVAEEGVVGQPVASVTAEEIGRLAMSGLSDIPSDLQGSADYRARVGAAMVARAWTGAVRETTTEVVHA
jgi:carbon-monoxide dehydrogenase medium subunit